MSAPSAVIPICQTGEFGSPVPSTAHEAAPFRQVPQMNAPATVPTYTPSLPVLLVTMLITAVFGLMVSRLPVMLIAAPE
jgi:hypothetical protein